MRSANAVLASKFAVGSVFSAGALFLGGASKSLLEGEDAGPSGHTGPKATWDRGWDMLENTNKSQVTRHLILIRHGQYDVHFKGDPPLTALGEKQADLTGARLADILSDKQVKAIHCSTMIRAEGTAAIIAQHFPDTPLHKTALLREGVPAESIPSSPSWQPTARTIHRDSSRIEAAFRSFFHRHQGKEGSQSNDKAKNSEYEIVVCHGNVIRYCVLRALQLPPQAWLRLAIWNCGITHIEIRPDGGVSMHALGDTGHLEKGFITYH